MKVLIKSAKIIAPESPFHQQKVAILLDKGKIEKIAPTINCTVDKEISIPNLHVSVGWFDSSVSFGEPGYEERETIENGLLAAAKSGFTAVALNPNTYPVTDHHGAVSFLKNRAAQSATHLYPIGALTQQAKGKELAEMYDMTTAGAVAFGDYKKAVADPNLLKMALQYAQSFGGLIQVFPHEEALSKHGMANEGVMSTKLGLKGIPAFAEELQVARDIRILEYTGGKLHIPTISTAQSLQLVAEAKKKGLDVTCSVAIYNLFFTDDELVDFETSFKVMPPLRADEDRRALIEGVKNGVIDMVTSDHCAMDIEHKKVEFEHAAFGSIGLESAFGALQTLFGVEKSVALLTKGRERFGIEAPVLAEKNKAELTFFIPNEKYTFSSSNIYSSAKNSMFLGANLSGKVKGVYTNNQLILNNDER